MILTVKKRVAYSSESQAVSGNPYAVTVSLDSEWTGATNVRVRVIATGGEEYEDFAVSEGSATVDMPTDVPWAELGVWADELHTTSPARVGLLPSILDITEGLAEAEP